MLTGKTPMIRARKLETKLNVGRIYLKLEGQNPTGHKFDRIAEVLVRSATAHHQTAIIVYGSHSYIKSILHFAQVYELDVIIPVFKNQRWKFNRFDPAHILDCRKRDNENVLEVLHELSAEKNAFLAAEGYSNTHISLMAMEELASEILHKVNYEVDSISIQLGYGYTMTGIYNALLKNWIKGKVDSFPQILCGTGEVGTTLYKKYLESFSVAELEATFSDYEPQSIPLDSFQMDEDLINETMKAVTETNSIITSIDEKDLKQAVKLIRSTEGIKMGYKEAYPMAAFLKKVERNEVKKGTHVILLNEASSMVQVEEFTDYNSLTKEQLIQQTRDFLADYRDSVEETSDAIANAMEKGHILHAKRDDRVVGICIIVRTGFNGFIPNYHLAYIGTSKESIGRGVGSELIQRAVDLTDGDISLHVDLDNKNAKKVYEKYGFKHVYNRMIYYGPTS